MTVHPHACGAYANLYSFPNILTGSSPRLWGIPLFSDYIQLRIRFIPTPVGHTFGFIFVNALKAVHPHACGAYTRKNPHITAFLV